MEIPHDNNEISTFEGTLKRTREGNALSQNLLGIWILNSQLPEAYYYQFKVKDIVFDESRGELCYQLSDGTHRFYQSMMMSYNEPSHSGRASRIFLNYGTLVPRFLLSSFLRHAMPLI